jgi:hypothetical protein
MLREFQTPSLWKATKSKKKVAVKKMGKWVPEIHLQV